MHHSNHWGTENLISAIETIAASYDSLHPETRLRINDMSLKYGGVFDLDNNWNVPHNSHRTGSNADIGFSGIGISGECTGQINLRDLEKIIEDETQIRPLNEANHFHIYFNN